MSHEGGKGGANYLYESLNSSLKNLAVYTSCNFFSFDEKYSYELHRALIV